MVLVLKLKCVRCNEISVESLHRFGSELQRMAPHHSAAYIGLHLLIPLLSVQKLFHIDALAQACAKLHTDLQILTRFEFQDHPTVVAHRNRLMVDGHRMVSMRRGVYKWSGKCSSDATCTRCLHHSRALHRQLLNTPRH